jgi:sigma-B regulation protein RsbU (phosphoserine phosphatase)
MAVAQIMVSMDTIFGATNHLPFHIEGPRTSDLLKVAPVVLSSATNAEVAAVFNEHPELSQLPVVASERPVGMIKRHLFMSEMAKPFYREVYERKSCDSFMEREPLIVEAAMRIEETLNLVVASGGKALTDGFMIVDNGKYLGVGSGLDLMRVVANLQATKNRQVTQSIEYASVIQRAMLWPSNEALRQSIPDSIIVWQPRDIVGGDFYHCVDYADGWFLLLADCTGHGVPGAFMTLISSSWLARGLEKHGPNDPAQLLAELNRSVKLSLGQLGRSSSGSASDDGLDAIAVWFHRESRNLTFASARTPMHVLGPLDEDVVTTEGERTGVGYVDTPMGHLWRNQTLTLAPDSIVCIATDGLIDQIGGARRISFGKRRLRNSILSLRDLRSNEVAAGLMDIHRGYQAEHRRRDDLTVIIFRT